MPAPENFSDRFEFKFALTSEQFCRAHRAYLAGALFSVKNIFLVTMALMIAAVQAQLFGGAEWALRVFGLIWVFVVGFIGFVYYAMPGRLYRTNPGLSREQTLLFEETGIHWSIPGLSRILLWKEIARFSLRKDFLIIKPTHGLPWVLPKTAFESEDQMKRLNDFVVKHLE